MNLGFLSTSMEEDKARFFADNLLFIITVKDERRDSVLDFGYADISKYSDFPNEKEVVFNPLNTFKIIKID